MTVCRRASTGHMFLGYLLAQLSEYEVLHIYAMFIRSALFRIFVQSHRTLSNVGISRNQGMKTTLSSLAFSQSRCYCKDTTNKKDSLDVEKENGESEDTIELFQVEEERNKLSKRKDLSKYKVFKDEDSPIIFDVEEERLLAQAASSTLPEKSDKFGGISLERKENKEFFH